MAHYIAVLVPERSGGWTILFPDLPGCASQGETLDEAIAMATDALAGHLAVARDYGDEIPAPRSLDDIRSDKEWCSENNVQWGRAMVAPILVRTPLSRPERVTISMDSNILREIDAYAERRDLTRSAVLTAGAELLLGRNIALAPSPASEMTDDEFREIVRDEFDRLSRPGEFDKLWKEQQLQFVIQLAERLPSPHSLKETAPKRYKVQRYSDAGELVSRGDPMTGRRRRKKS